MKLLTIVLIGLLSLVACTRDYTNEPCEGNMYIMHTGAICYWSLDTGFYRWCTDGNGYNEEENVISRYGEGTWQKLNGNWICKQ